MFEGSTGAVAERIICNDSVYIVINGIKSLTL